MSRLTPGIRVEEIKNKKFAAHVRMTDFGPCSFCGWGEDGPVSTCVVVGDPKLRHKHSMRGAGCATTQASVCSWCQPYVRWRNEKRHRGEERYRCPVCFPMTPEEATAVKLERESGEHQTAREAREMVRETMKKYVGQMNTPQLRAQIESDIVYVLRSIGLTRPPQIDFADDDTPFVGDVDVQV